MEIHVRDDRKIVEVWLTNADQQNPAIEESLEPLYQQCKERKYFVAVFKSGTENLTEETSALLCRNKRRSAELEVQRAKKRRLDMAR